MTHFIHKVTFPHLTLSVLSALADTQVLHERIATEFVSPQGSRTLWRLTTNPTPSLLVVTGGPRRGTDDFEGTVATKTYAPSTVLDKGSVYRFALTANPARTRSDGSREVHLNRDRQIEWLHATGYRSGFEVLDVTVRHEIVPLRRSAEKGGESKLLRAEFDGTLRIGDPQRVESALLNGLGKGKAFGCGLLTLAR